MLIENLHKVWFEMAFDKNFHFKSLILYQWKKFLTCNNFSLLLTIVMIGKEHIMDHRKERSFACSHCEKSFKRNTHLKSHQTTHTGERGFCCTECGKTCTTAGNLKVHRKIHTGEGLFSCKDCKKTFTQSGSLKIHKNVHTGARPSSCNQCTKSFKDQGSLKKHQRSILIKNLSLVPNVSAHLLNVFNSQST